MINAATSLTDARSNNPELVTPRTQPSKIKLVVLATDLTSASEIATDQAIDLAASIGCRLLIVNVIGPNESGVIGSAAPYSSVVRADQQRASRECPLLGIVNRARAKGVVASFLLWTGEPGQSIVAAAHAEGADLIVVGTRGLDSAGRFLLGSVSDYVVYHSSCPVLVAH